MGGVSDIHVGRGKQNDPPVTPPSYGDTYIVGANPTGAWANFAEDSVVAFDHVRQTWVNTSSLPGHRLFMLDTGSEALYDGNNWLGMIAPWVQVENIGQLPADHEVFVTMLSYVLTTDGALNIALDIDGNEVATGSIPDARTVRGYRVGHVRDPLYRGNDPEVTHRITGGAGTVVSLETRLMGWVMRDL